MSRFKGRRFSLLLILILTLSVVLQGLTPVAFAEEAPAGSAASDYETHWAKEAILSAMASGIVQGYPDGSFKPNNAITRAEFFVMVNNAFKFTATSPVTFSDVSADAWYAPHVARAQAAGYITGYPDGTIRPGNNITRQEAAAIIFNLKKLVADEMVIANFADASLFPAWSKGPVGAVVKAGFMKGYPDNTFKPAGLITRAESVMVVQNSQADQTAQPMMINIAAIPGVTAPATGSTPVAAITATAQYTGTVSWSPAAASFSGGTVYTATITLTPKPGFTLMGVSANFFTVAGATATNAAGSGVVTAVFPATQVAFFGGGGVIITPPAPVLVTSITVTSAGDLTTIAEGQTLQMTATVLPSGASNKNVNWSVVNNTGSASISNSGLLTAMTDGTVTVKAKAVDGSNVEDVFEITITDPILVSGITVTADGSVTSMIPGKTLQMNAAILPLDATFKTVVWSVENGTGSASIDSATGIMTTISIGTVTVKATATDGSEVSGSLLFTVTTPVSSISIAGAGGMSSLDVDGTLQMIATVLPAEAGNKTVLWSIANESMDTGLATIDPTSGLLTATGVGTVTVKSTATDGSNVEGILKISIYAKAKLLFTFDDGWKDTFETAYPILSGAGFKGTIYVNRDLVFWPSDWVTVNPSAVILSTVDLDNLYKANWDIANHTVNHLDYVRLISDSSTPIPNLNKPGDYIEYATRTDLAALTEMRRVYLDNQNWLLSDDNVGANENLPLSKLNWYRGAYHAAYPSGLYSPALIRIIQGLGVLTGRTTIDGNQSHPVSDFYGLPVQYVETEYVTVINPGENNLAQVIAAIDTAIKSTNPQTVILMIHKVADQKIKDDDLITLESDLQAIVDLASIEVDDGKLSVLTISEWYNAQADTTPVTGVNFVDPVTGSILDNPSIEIPVGASTWLTANVSPIGAKNRVLTWSSAPAGVVEVDNAGTVVGISPGTATITASLTLGTTTFSASSSITVVNNKEITSANAIPDVIQNANDGRTLDQIKSVLGKNVILMAGTTEVILGVEWDSDSIESYDNTKPGTYVLKGSIGTYQYYNMYGTFSKGILPIGYVDEVDPITEVTVTINVM